MKLPQRARIVEIAPRDGFQSVKPWIGTADKISVLKALLDAGADYIEATSFVSPKAIEQMKDAAEVMAAISDHLAESGPAEDGKAPSPRVCALVPNLRGAENAAACGVRSVAVVISASEAHNLNNVRRTPSESLDELAKIRQAFPDLHVKLDVATAFGCPFIGEVPLDKIFLVIDRAVELGITDVVLCDTVGVANPLQTRRVIAKVLQRYAPYPMDYALHMHNTRGLAAANTLAALELGIDRFETAAGGLGGCPFAPGASGNMATEDLLFMLNELGVRTNMSLEGTVGCAEYLKDKIGLCLDSKINRLTMRKVTAAQT